MEEKHFIVTLFYKSGNKFIGRFSDFSVKNGQWTYTSKPNSQYPDIPMLLLPDNVEAVFYHQE